ncbi:tRNA modification GTPase MnmE [Clostridium sp. CAG:253]|nr:tRNA modification GTPase MnmE [Clostridium sp. CAG:253]
MYTKTIASIASGMGGGIGVIRISGDDALTVAGKIFRKRSQIDLTSECEKDGIQYDDKYFWKKESHTIHYGFIVDNGKVIDEVMVLLMKKPNSYTREDVVEIDSHGGPFIVKKILETVLKNGAVLAEPGEFTKRAFLNGRIDLAQAEAVMKLISSENNYALDSALSQLEGNLSKYIENIRQDILHDTGYIEAALDDPEHYELGEFRFELKDKLQNDREKLNELIEHFDDGRMKSEGINTVIVGKPNAGKSSLMNLLLDEERAIVTNVAGTTRDILEERVKLGDVILNLVDTAGIHETNDIVENIGVNKAIEYADKCDFIIYVVDSSERLDDADFQIIDILQQKKGVILMNKSDLNPVITVEDIQKKLNWECITFSNETKQGMKELENYVNNSFLDGNISFNNQVYLTGIRHKEAVVSAIESINAVLQAIDDDMPEDFYTIDMMDAYKELGLINGETASEDLVNKIFKEFCMGK